MGIERIGITIARDHTRGANLDLGFDDNLLDTFHAFRVRETCLAVANVLPASGGRVCLDQKRIAQTIVFPMNVWKKIFNHLRPLDLFSLCLTAKVWSTAFDFRGLRSRHILLWTEEQRLALYDLCKPGSPIYKNPFMRYIDAKTPLTVEEFKSIKVNLSKTISCNQVKIQTAVELDAFIAVNRVPPQVGPDVIVMSDAFHVSLIELLLQNIPSTKELIFLRCEFHHLNIIADLRCQLVDLDLQMKKLRLVKPAVYNIGKFLLIRNEQHRIRLMIQQLTISPFLANQSVSRYELEKESLPHLVKISFITSTCTLLDIQELMRLAPNLSEIFIKDCSCLSEQDINHLSASVKILLPIGD